MERIEMRMNKKSLGYKDSWWGGRHVVDKLKRAGSIKIEVEDCQSSNTRNAGNSGSKDSQ